MQYNVVFFYKLLLLLAIGSLVTYVVLTNERHKERFLEGFTDTKVDDGSPGTPPANTNLSPQVVAIYKKVYGVKPNDEKVKTLLDELNNGGMPFDAQALENSLRTQRQDDIETMIGKVYMKELNRTPTPTELKIYGKKFMQNEMKSEYELIRILANSPESVNDAVTKESAKEDAMKKEDYDVYKQIIDVFNKVLDRFPNAAELNHYYTQVRASKLTVKKLEETLYASREFELLSKNQVNVVHGELPGNITEKQVEIVLKSLYASVNGGKKPDTATYVFLKNKFVDFNLDEERMLRFMNNLKNAEVSGVGVAASRIPISKKEKKRVAKKAKGTDTETYLEHKPDLLNRVLEKPENVHVVGGNGSDDIENESVNVYSQGESTKAHKILKEAAHDQISTQKVIENINDKHKCVFDKNKMEKILENNDKQALANFMNDRNAERCAFDSKRVQKFSNADDNLVLFPEFKWSVPMQRPPVCSGNQNTYSPLMDQTALIGTLLTDAKDTNVGSILPMYPRK